jgi:hypothetical protein
MEIAVMTGFPAKRDMKVNACQIRMLLNEPM